MELTGKQRKHLRGLAHDLKPVVHIGSAGLSDAVVRQLDAALDDHELIKVKFVDHKDEKKELAASMAQRLRCADVGHIGHHVILYRQARQPERRQIRLPRAPKAD